MKLTIETVNAPTPPAPRTWTADEMRSGIAPIGWYADCHRIECILVQFGRPPMYFDERGPVESQLCNGPYTHVGTVAGIVVRVDRTKAVR